MSPNGMLKLPEDKLVCPLVEPSQQLWPHWSLVVLHQGVREVIYTVLGIQRKCVGGSDDPVVSRPIESPQRALTASKRVCFVRHGQGAHNRTIANWGIVDPELTSEGEAQVADLHERLKPFIPEVQLIVVSPLTRAMQTATGGFAGSSAPYVLTPILRERLGAPCDTGRTKTELLRCFPEIVNWEGTDTLPEVWWATETEYDLLDRVDQLKAWITARPEQVRSQQRVPSIRPLGAVQRSMFASSMHGFARFSAAAAAAAAAASLSRPVLSRLAFLTNCLLPVLISVHCGRWPRRPLLAYPRVPPQELYAPVP